MQPNSSDAAPATDGNTYDVVIVGAGMSGGIIAMELAQKNFKVLILEAGQANPAARQDYMEQFLHLLRQDAGVGVSAQPAEHRPFGNQRRPRHDQ